MKLTKLLTNAYKRLLFKDVKWGEEVVILNREDCPSKVLPPSQKYLVVYDEDDEFYYYYMEESPSGRSVQKELLDIRLGTKVEVEEPKRLQEEIFNYSIDIETGEPAGVVRDLLVNAGITFTCKVDHIRGWCEFNFSIDSSDSYIWGKFIEVKKLLQTGSIKVVKV